jgi:uncharacterized membrane protein
VSAMTTERPEVEAYLAAVRDELADLRPDERDDLLAEVEASLLEAAEESDAPIAARLGPPADFAAELRAAAGLAAGVPPRPRRDRLAGFWRSPRTASLKGVLVELAPLWWVARAYVVVALIAWAVDAQWSLTAPFVPKIGIGGPGSAGTGLLLLALALALSVALGLWERRRGGPGTVSVAVNVFLAIAALPLAGDLVERASNRADTTTVFVDSTPTPGLALNGNPIENVYPYSRDGRLLLDVLLYDQTGAPIDLRPDEADPSRRVLEAADGTQRFNAFPVRYFEPGTGTVARPRAAPPISWARIVTPPLRKPER